ncbi:hypothetical protein CLOM_g1969 [Closterium sp. NIES-68]|nr:hypothetical protein CLOM_g1969 [Closterium sp. NIES-68]GJP59645.1 hypothetical protein CLOP_g13920 [Closterium sp. NIES-67]
MRAEDIDFKSSTTAGIPITVSSELSTGVRYIARHNSLYRQQVKGPGRGSPDSLQDGDAADQRFLRFESENGRSLNFSESSQLPMRLRECFLAARAYLAVADEFQDNALTEQVQQEIERCILILDEASSIASSDDQTVAGLETKHPKSKTKKGPRDGKSPLSRLKLRLEAAEHQTKSVLLQSMVFSQIASRAVPQTLHCLSLRLTLAWTSNQSNNGVSDPGDARLRDPSLYHYAIFSDNVIAVAVVLNSTAMNADEPLKHAFHIVTDRMNYAAMKSWFMLNPPAGGMAWEVRSLDEYPWINPLYIPVLRQIESDAMRDYYFRTAMGPRVAGNPGKEDYIDLKYRNPKYLSILNHLRFYLPTIFPDLSKILFLDDDVVVQKDLTGIWEVPMHGKVNLAVETCGKVFHRFKTYLNFSSPLLKRYDPEGCGWAYGMNLFDLDAWRAGNYTEKYHYWQQQNENRTLWKLGTLPPGLLTFYNATESLDKKWQVLGLGSKSTVNLESIKNAAVIHFNGHAKPWLELAIPVYKHFWTRYVPYDNDFLQQCKFREPVPDV